MYVFLLSEHSLKWSSGKLPLSGGFGGMCLAGAPPGMARPPRAVLTLLADGVVRSYSVTTKKNTEVNDYTSANRRCIGALCRAQVLAQREEEQAPEPQLCAELGEALSLRGLLLTLRAAALGVGAAPRACATQ